MLKSFSSAASETTGGNPALPHRLTLTSGRLASGPLPSARGAPPGLAPSPGGAVLLHPSKHFMAGNVIAPKHGSAALATDVRRLTMVEFGLMALAAAFAALIVVAGSA